MSIEVTSQGVRKNYGPRATEDKAPSCLKTYGVRRELELTFSYDDLPAPDTDNAAEDNVVARAIPAGSVIEAAYVKVTTDFNSTSGTTVVNFGLSQEDGTEIDFDGLATITADGSNAGTVIGAGADIGTVADQSNDAFIEVSETVGDLTAGEAKLVVIYTDLS